MYRVFALPFEVSSNVVHMPLFLLLTCSMCLLADAGTFFVLSACLSVLFVLPADWFLFGLGGGGS